MSFSFLDLPAELLSYILWYLDLADLHSCQRAHSILYTAIKDSTLSKYLTTLKVSGMEDNRLHTSMSTADRLDLLRRHENAWSLLQFRFRQMVPVPSKLSWPLDLDGGNFFILDNRLSNFHYITLPSTNSDKPQWSYLNTDSSPQDFGRVLDFDLAIAEHDLIAITTKFVI